MNERIDMNERIETLVELFAAKVASYFHTNLPNLEIPIVKVSYGKKYAKIIRDTSVAGFVDMTTGDILRAKSWKGPALYSRGKVGNVKDEDFGISNFTDIGVKYLN
jgi:hypothetical protein